MYTFVYTKELPVHFVYKIQDVKLEDRFIRKFIFR